MNTAKKNNSGIQDDNRGLYLGVGIFAAMLLTKLWMKLKAAWLNHQVLLSFLAVLILAVFATAIAALIKKKLESNKYEKSITEKDENTVLLGTDVHGATVHLKQVHRTTHAQVIGTTSAGKTESIILPWAISDIESGSGLLMIDGKADRSLLDKLYAFTVRAGRQNDFRLFSFSEVEASSSFNPLSGASANEIAERVFSSFPAESSYYRSVQFSIFRTIVEALLENNKIPTFEVVRRLLIHTNELTALSGNVQDIGLKEKIGSIAMDNEKARLEKISGLESNLSHFTSGSLAPLYNSVTPEISFDDVLRNNRICYFQLPSMYYPFLAEATGKLVLQAFQNAIAKRHLGLEGKGKFFSCYLDDFQDYIYPGFGALLNKSRSANIGMVFSHQSLGDLEKVGPAFKDVVLSNTNIKCVMRMNDPITSDYFSKMFGTRKTEKTTERRKSSFFVKQDTGDQSVREVDEYIVHPNEIRNLGTGEGFVSIPHQRGVKTLKVFFKMRENLAPMSLPKVIRSENVETLVRKTS